VRTRIESAERLTVRTSMMRPLGVVSTVAAPCPISIDINSLVERRLIKSKTSLPMHSIRPVWVRSISATLSRSAMYAAFEFDSFPWRGERRPLEWLVSEGLEKEILLFTPFWHQAARRLSGDQTLNDVPQPQEVFALGLLKTNPLPFKPPEYSRVVPARNT